MSQKKYCAIKILVWWSAHHQWPICSLSWYRYLLPSHILVAHIELLADDHDGLNLLVWLVELTVFIQEIEPGFSVEITALKYGLCCTKDFQFSPRSFRTGTPPLHKPGLQKYYFLRCCTMHGVNIILDAQCRNVLCLSSDPNQSLE